MQNVYLDRVSKLAFKAVLGTGFGIFSGALVVHPQHDIVSEAFDQTHVNPLSSACLLALKDAINLIGTKQLKECTLYSTLLPSEADMYYINQCGITKVQFVVCTDFKQLYKYGEQYNHINILHVWNEPIIHSYKQYLLQNTL